VGGIANLQGAPQPLPAIGPKRLRDCQWPVSARLRIPRDWLSGVYLGRLRTRRSGLESYVVFIVRDDRRADFLFQCSDHTWQAYNRWPDHFALYDNGEHQWWWGGDVQVSFNRPYGRYCQIFDAPLSQGSGEFLLWEFPIAFWLEREGYDISYISNQDTHSDRDGLRRAHGFLSVGHDEYWTPEMFRNVQSAIRDGTHVAFLSGNAVCGRIALSRDTAGHRDRVFERTGVYGPPGGTRDFIAMKSLPHERPYANELVGAHSTGPVTGGADWTCALPDHWLFRDTGMKRGDSIPGIVGWEWHGDPAPIPGLEIVATGPTQEAPGKPNGGTYTSTLYPGPKGNVVFNAATIWWGDGLSEPPGYKRPSVYTTPKGPDAGGASVLTSRSAVPSFRPSWNLELKTPALLRPHGSSWMRMLRHRISNWLVFLPTPWTCRPMNPAGVSPSFNCAAATPFSQVLISSPVHSIRKWFHSPIFNAALAASLVFRSTSQPRRPSS